jgi:RNA polymerase sigma-70 factor (ECF subfamily)
VSDDELVARLKVGEEQAFREVVELYQPALLRLARTFVSTAALAEDVVQDTWLGVVRGIGRFEGRSSLKTWIFRILVNRARTAGAREPRSVAFGGPDGPSDDRFTRGGAWSDPPVPWPEEVDDRLAAVGAATVIRAAIGDLPDAQRQVVTLRDVEGLSSNEVCDLLGLSEGNQRVLLHRARTKVRSVLEQQLKEV